MKEYMIDIETLGKYENAVVLSLACVTFDLSEQRKFEELVSEGIFLKFDASEQIEKYKRDVDKSTLEWWEQQGPAAKFISYFPNQNDVSLKSGLDTLKDWLISSGYDFNTSRLWARGSDFDFPKVESLFRNIGEKAPYNTFRTRDTRTFIDTLTGSYNGKFDGIPNPKSFVYHHPLHDAALEAVKLCHIHNNKQFR